MAAGLGINRPETGGFFVHTRLALRLEEAIKERAKANQKQAGGAVPQKSAEAVETREEIAKLAGVSRDTVEEGHPGTVPECPAPAITARPMEGRDGGEGLAESLPQRVAFDSASIRQVTLFPARLKSS